MDGCVYINPDDIAQQQFGDWNTLEITLLNYGISKKDFADILGLHYQTVISWCNGKRKISQEALSILQKIEDEFWRDFEFSYRYIQTEFDEKKRKYLNELYLPLYLKEEDYLRYGADETGDLQVPFAVRQSFTLNIARIWRSRGAAVHVVEFDAERYRAACKKSGQADVMNPKALSMFLFVSKGEKANSLRPGNKLEANH
jgi:transcriptional regulator with XRE-family HTH domain